MTVSVTASCIPPGTGVSTLVPLRNQPWLLALPGLRQ